MRDTRNAGEATPAARRSTSAELNPSSPRRRAWTVTILAAALTTAGGIWWAGAHGPPHDVPDLAAPEPRSMSVRIGEVTIAPRLDPVPIGPTLHADRIPSVNDPLEMRIVRQSGEVSQPPQGAWLTGTIEEPSHEPAVSSAARITDEFPVRR